MTRALRYFGAALAFGLIATVAARGIGDMPPLEAGEPSTWGWLGAGLALYCLSQVIGALAWGATLRAFGVALPRGRAASQLLVSQIGKYLPGNVAHFFGRLAVAKADGVAAALATSAMLLEICLVVGAGLSVAGALLLALPEFRVALATSLGEIFASGTALAFPVGVVVAILGGQIFLRRRTGQRPVSVARLSVPLACHFLNFGVLGLSLWCAGRALSPDGEAGALAATAIFSVAWVAGFLTPGAPGGLGVRDGLLALGLGLFIGEGEALAVAVAHRALSTLGDVTIFCLGLALRRTPHSREGTGGPNSDSGTLGTR